MTKKELTVEERIKQNYQAEDGIWLVQAGKVTEAKLLKEAYERIESLKKIAIHNKNMYDNEADKRAEPWRNETYKLRKDNDDLKKKLERQKWINSDLIKKYQSIKHAVAEIELLSDKAEESS